MPRVVARAIADSAERSASRGRMDVATIGDSERAMADLRGAIARLLASDPERVAVTQNTTHGVNVVVWGLEWEPGDEVITTALEHPGVAAPLFVLSQRQGVRLRVIPRDEAQADLAGAVARRTGPRTRLVALSHVAYGTGTLLDVAGASAAAREVGALSLVDGAQAVGAVRVAPEALGVDAYALPAQKWLLGPEGLGALWLSEAATGRVALTFASDESGEAHAVGGAFEPHPGARRFELSTPPRDVVAGWRAALAWLEELGGGWVEAETLRAAASGRAALARVPDVQIVTPPGDHAGLVAFAVEGRDPSVTTRALSRLGVSVRTIGHPPCLRLSAGFFTSDDDLERLCAGIVALGG